jgi:Putative transposase/Transposase zinc-binding domain
VSELAELFHQEGAAYRAKYGERLLASHRRALSDIEHCRTEVMGGHVYDCERCQAVAYSYPWGRNRHCPKCQNQAGQAWLEGQQQLLLPTPYFMVTFTLPEPLRRLTRSHQTVMYNLLVRTAAAALQELAQDRRFVGGQIGLVGVLQTWARDLSYHPPLHFLVPGGGLSADGRQWLAARPGFLVHVRALSKLFRAKFRTALQKTALFEQVPAPVWRQAWVVHSEAVGDGQAALKYLAPYIFRVASSNKRLVKIAEGQVTFRYTPSGRTKSKLRTLPAEEFICRFLQHVLPKGFVKVRYYGLFAPGQRHRLKQARTLLEADKPPEPAAELDPELTPTEAQAEPPR